MVVARDEGILVTVRYYVLFCIAANYCRIENFDLKGSSDLGELIKLIYTKYGSRFRELVFDEAGNLKPTAWFILNGKKIGPEGLSAAQLADGDELVITSPLLVGG